MTEEKIILHRLAGWSFYVKGAGEFILNVPGRDMIKDINLFKLEKERDYLWGFMLKLKNKLENKNFVDKAPKDVVNKEIKKWNDSWERFDMIDKALKYLEEKNG